VVSGAAAFDCGDAVLIGLASDHLEYPNGNETVKVKADYFGSGTASLKLYLDDVQADERTVILADWQHRNRPHRGPRSAAAATICAPSSAGTV